MMKSAFLRQLAIDPNTGAPTWGGASGNPTKAAFALKAAEGLLSGAITLSDLKHGLIGAANHLLRLRKKNMTVSSMKQVQQGVSGTAYMWFQEIQRVASSEEALRLLVAQNGRGLTALYRAIGASQYQPGHANLSRPSVAQKLSEAAKPTSRITKAVNALSKALAETPTTTLIRHQDDLRRALSGIEETLAQVERSALRD